MEVESVDRHLERIAAKLAATRSGSKADTALMGLALGALYALKRASDLGYSDRSGQSLPDDYELELSGVAQDLASGSVVLRSGWLSAFYFNSAVLRLDALGDRLAGLAVRAVRRAGARRRGQRRATHPVKDDAGKLKHEPEGLLPVRRASLEDTVQQLEHLTQKLLRSPVRVVGPQQGGS